MLGVLSGAGIETGERRRERRRNRNRNRNRNKTSASEKKKKENTKSKEQVRLVLGYRGARQRGKSGRDWETHASILIPTLVSREWTCVVLC